MVDSFNAIKYTTSYGENCVATKNNGVVTIQGDKNGVRQMSEKEFMECFVKDQAKATLERSPKQDTVSFSSNHNKNREINDKDVEELNKYVIVSNSPWYDMSHKRTVKGEGFDVKIKDNVLVGGRNVNGKICNRDVNLTLVGNSFNLAKGTIKGTIDNKEVKLKYQGTNNGIKFEGAEDVDSSVLLHIASLTCSYVSYLIEQDEAMAAAAIATGKF